MTTTLGYVLKVLAAAVVLAVLLAGRKKPLR